MVQGFNVEQVIFICRSTLKTEPNSQCRRECRQNFSDINMPRSCAVHKIAKFKTTGSVLNIQIQQRQRL
jgi:hypothetical protein